MSDLTQAVLLFAVIFAAIQAMECARFLKQIYRILHVKTTPEEKQLIHDIWGKK